MKVKTFVIVLLVPILLNFCSPKQNIPPTLPLSTSTLVSPTTITVSETLGSPFSTSYKIMPSVNSENILTIKNTSNVALKNLIVKICTVQISSNWQQDIQGIRSLVIELNKSAPEFTQEYQYDDKCFSVGDDGKLNVALLRFNSLPANHDIDLTIKMKSDVRKPERNCESKVYIKIPASLFSGEINEGIITGNAIYFFGDSLVYFFAEKWALANLYVQITCENCVGKWESYRYSLFKERSVVNCKIHSRDEFFIRMSCAFLFTYFADDASTHSSEKETLYFLATRNPNNESNVSEITREQFESNTP